VSTRIRNLLQHQWQYGGWLATLLRPFSLLTAWAVGYKRAAYLASRWTVYRPNVPVVVIGSIYVGGTGKTPMLIATVQNLRVRGWTPGVVSRGYGVTIGPLARVGQGALKPCDFGDEPALIARTTHAPVAVHPRRALAAQALLRAHPEVDVIVADDGLQHLALARDIEIAVKDERGVGNGHLLPAGPLREPSQRLHSVDAVITTLSSAPTQHPNNDAPTAHTRLLQMWLVPEEARHLNSARRRPLSDFADARTYPQVAAAAGVGNPERFFTTLREAGVKLAATLSLPDHYDYAHSPFGSLNADIILITAKDAIKCDALQDDRLWEIPVHARFSDPTLFDWLVTALSHYAPAQPGKDGVVPQQGAASTVPDS
jgi:tetraacyldisaccharide 4'-kinase